MARALRYACGCVGADPDMTQNAGSPIAVRSACRQLLGLFKAEILSNMLGEDVMDLSVPGNGLLHTVLWIYV